MKPKRKNGSTAFVSTLTVFGGLLFLIYIFNRSPLLFYISLLLLLLGIYPRIYLRMVSQNVYYKNDRVKLYLTNGDRGSLTFQFVNEGRLPILGTCQIAHDSVFKIDGEEKIDQSRFLFPLSLQKKSSIQVTLPFQTRSRGVGKIDELILSISDPLKLMSIHFQYEFVRQEVVIYPKKQAVGGLEVIQLIKEGTHPRINSLFYDRSLPIGTRDYAQGDSLKDIHWKATARKGELQTKLVEKTMGMTWSFVVIIGQNMQKTDIEKLEDQLSSIARLAELAHKRGIDFDLIINTKPMGRAIIMQSQAGNDRPHYFRIMERLSLIQVNFLRIRADLALREMDRGFTQPRVIFFTGALDEIKNDPILSQWVKRGHRLYQVEEEGLINPINKGGKRLAN